MECKVLTSRAALGAATTLGGMSLRLRLQLAPHVCHGGVRLQLALTPVAAVRRVVHEHRVHAVPAALVAAHVPVLAQAFRVRALQVAQHAETQVQEDVQPRVVLQQALDGGDAAAQVVVGAGTDQAQLAELRAEVGLDGVQHGGGRQHGDHEALQAGQPLQDLQDGVHRLRLAEVVDADVAQAAHIRRGAEQLPALHWHALKEECLQAVDDSGHVQEVRHVLHHGLDLRLGHPLGVHLQQAEQGVVLQRAHLAQEGHVGLAQPGALAEQRHVLALGLGGQRHRLQRVLAGVQQRGHDAARHLLAVQVQVAQASELARQRPAVRVEVAVAAVVLLQLQGHQVQLQDGAPHGVSVLAARVVPPRVEVQVAQVANLVADHAQRDGLEVEQRQGAHPAGGLGQHLKTLVFPIIVHCQLLRRNADRSKTGGKVHKLDDVTYFMVVERHLRPQHNVMSQTVPLLVHFTDNVYEVMHAYIGKYFDSKFFWQVIKMCHIRTLAMSTFMV